MCFGTLCVEVFMGMYTLQTFVQPSMDKPCNPLRFAQPHTLSLCVPFFDQILRLGLRLFSHHYCETLRRLERRTSASENVHWVSRGWISKRVLKTLRESSKRTISANGVGLGYYNYFDGQDIL